MEGGEDEEAVEEEREADGVKNPMEPGEGEEDRTRLESKTGKGQHVH
jgi:hypothetical protein